MVIYKNETLIVYKALLVGIVRVVLVQEIEGFRLGAADTSDPLWGGEDLRSIGSDFVREDVLKGLGPADTVVKLGEVPEQLQEVEEGAVGVGGVRCVGCTLVVDEGVCWDPGGDDE